MNQRTWKERFLGKPGQGWLDDVENDLKKMEENSQETRRLETDSEGGHDPAWNIEPMEKKKKKKLETQGMENNGQT